VETKQRLKFGVLVEGSICRKPKQIVIFGSLQELKITLRHSSCAVRPIKLSNAPSSTAQETKNHNPKTCCEFSLKIVTAKNYRSYVQTFGSNCEALQKVSSGKLHPQLLEICKTILAFWE